MFFSQSLASLICIETGKLEKCKGTNFWHRLEGEWDGKTLKRLNGLWSHKWGKYKVYHFVEDKLQQTDEGKERQAWSSKSQNRGLAKHILTLEDKPQHTEFFFKRSEEETSLFF